MFRSLPHHMPPSRRFGLQPLPPNYQHVFDLKQSQDNVVKLAAPAGVGGIVRYEHRTQVREAIAENAGLGVPLLVMNVLAAVVASYGLFADSPAVIIAAAIVAMVVGPILGLALALVDGNGPLLGKAMIGQLGGMSAVLAASFLIGLIHRDSPLTHEIQIRTAPDLFSLTIALAAGAAAAYAAISPRLSVVVAGAATALSLVPPLAACGLCLARHEPILARGSFELFLTHFVAIHFASSAVLWLSGYHDVTGVGTIRRQGRERFFLTRAINLLILLLLTFITGTSLLGAVAKQTYQASTRAYLIRKLAVYPGVHLTDVRFGDQGDTESVTAIVRSPYSFSPKRVRDIEGGLPQADGKNIEFEVMAAIVKESNGNGYMAAPTRIEPSVTHNTKMLRR